MKSMGFQLGVTVKLRSYAERYDKAVPIQLLFINALEGE